MHVGLIRVLTTSDRRLLQAHGKLLHETVGMTVTSRCVSGPPSCSLPVIPGSRRRERLPTA